MFRAEAGRQATAQPGSAHPLPGSFDAERAAPWSLTTIPTGSSHALKMRWISYRRCRLPRSQSTLRCRQTDIIHGCWTPKGAWIGYSTNMSNHDRAGHGPFLPSPAHTFRTSAICRHRPGLVASRKDQHSQPLDGATCFHLLPKWTLSPLKGAQVGRLITHKSTGKPTPIFPSPYHTAHPILIMHTS